MASSYPVADRSDQPATILVVEDDVSIARLLEALLGSAGYAVRVERDGRTGLDAAQTERPALILLDLTLPELDGWDVLDRLRAAGDAPPVVLLTGHARIASRATSAGAAAVVIKPFDVDDLLSTVERLLA
jgi:two-component system OmpR family response regulator